MARKGFVTLLLGSTLLSSLLLGFAAGRAALATDQPVGGSPTGRQR
jgi:hypothetical protein